MAPRCFPACPNRGWRSASASGRGATALDARCGKRESGPLTSRSSASASGFHAFEKCPKSRPTIGLLSLRMIPGVSAQPNALGREAPDRSQRLVQQVGTKPSTARGPDQAERGELDLCLVDPLEFAEPDAVVAGSEHEDPVGWIDEEPVGRLGCHGRSPGPFPVAYAAVELEIILLRY